MYTFKRLFCFLFAITLIFSFSACSPVDENYGISSEASLDDSAENGYEYVEVGEDPIMSSDRVMSKFFDISLFDEENYSDIYLGKKFKIEASFAGYEIPVPTKIDTLKKMGWQLADGNIYDENSLIFSYETIETVFQDTNGLQIKAWFYNSSRSSVQLKECYIVKLLIENDFYSNPEQYNSFNINGITNSMAVTDVIDTLGTPSHFYAVSDTCYYLDYFITKKDRRNGITVYINPVDDNVISVEFSYYK